VWLDGDDDDDVFYLDISLIRGLQTKVPMKMMMAMITQSMVT